LLRAIFWFTSSLSGTGTTILHSRIQGNCLLLLIFYREKGDTSKVRDFLPQDKQYLVVRGVPCLRRATSLAYTDADEDAERLLSFGDGANGAPDGDEWVETHAGRKASNKGADHSEIADIPDMDAHGEDDHGLAGAIGGMSIGGHGEGKETDIIDIDEIPDMEEDDLEAGDEATAAPKAPAAVPSTGAPVAKKRVEPIENLHNDF
jgi:ubiquitin-like-conjugating enzyme ATG3